MHVRYVRTVVSRAVDGSWGSWERWGQVTATCGTGMRERRRRCDNPRPNFCGRSCSGPDVDTEAFDTGVACKPVCGEKKKKEEKKSLDFDIVITLTLIVFVIDAHSQRLAGGEREREYSYCVRFFMYLFYCNVLTM